MPWTEYGEKAKCTRCGRTEDEFLYPHGADELLKVNCIRIRCHMRKALEWCREHNEWMRKLH